MADLKYRDEHNKVGFLEKPKGSADYHQESEIEEEKSRMFSSHKAANHLLTSQLMIQLSHTVVSNEDYIPPSFSFPLMLLLVVQLTLLKSLLGLLMLHPTWKDPYVHANQGLSADLLGPDVNEDNFAARMVAIIAERRTKFAAQRRSLKRQGARIRNNLIKKSNRTEPQRTFVPAASRPSSAGVTLDVHQSPFVDTLPATPPHSPKASSHPDVTPDTSKQPSVAPIPPSGFSATHTVNQEQSWRKSLGSRKMSSSEVDLSAADSQPPSVEVPSQKA
ncbi:hypothetical protein Tco_1465760 [Tanacetum coccineum]